MELFKRALEQLASGLEPSKGLKRVEKAFIWPFQKGKIKGILSAIENQKSLFDLALQNDLM